MNGKKARMTLFFPLNTMSKLFCSCPNSDAARKSSFPICQDMPGAMPLINKHALNIAIAAGCMLKVHFNASSFERKPVFYGERLLEYTLTQENAPLGTAGCLRINNDDIKISKIYLEQETGMQDGQINYNRRGRPLLGIETAAELDKAETAYAAYKLLQARLEKKELLKSGRKVMASIHFINGAEITGIETDQLEQAFIWGETARKARYLWRDGAGKRTGIQYGRIFYPNANLCSIHVDPEWIRRVRMEFGV